MDRNYKLGIFYGLAAYTLWGILPIYWKQLQHVEAMEILASRFLWSAVFVLFLLIILHKFSIFIEETKIIFSSWHSAVCMIAAAVDISFNWGIFIWAVEQGRIVETSMGYYINPLMSILFGMIFLNEKLDKMQKVAVVFAALGIGYMIFQNGSLPWISISLAVTFASYGLLKKIIAVQPLTSIMLETLLITPLMLGYLCYLSSHGGNIYETCDVFTLMYLVGAGAATAVPLLLFTGCARLLPLKMVGFMQYIAPTISLLLGIFIYGEDFNSTYILSFGLIWIGLIFFTWSQIKK